MGEDASGCRELCAKWRKPTPQSHQRVHQWRGSRSGRWLGHGAVSKPLDCRGRAPARRQVTARSTRGPFHGKGSGKNIQGPAWAEIEKGRKDAGWFSRALWIRSRIGSGVWGGRGSCASSNLGKWAALRHRSFRGGRRDRASGFWPLTQGQRGSFFQAHIRLCVASCVWIGCRTWPPRNSKRAARLITAGWWAMRVNYLEGLLDASFFAAPTHFVYNQRLQILLEKDQSWPHQ